MLIPLMSDAWLVRHQTYGYQIFTIIYLFIITIYLIYIFIQATWKISVKMEREYICIYNYNNVAKNV